MVSYLSIISVCAFKTNSNQIGVRFYQKSILLFLLILCCFTHKGYTKSPTVELGSKEEAWLKEHPQIKLGTGREWSPYVIVADDGTLSGIEVDLIKRINEIAGTNIRIIVGERLKIIEKAKARQIDGLLTSSVQKTTAPYFLFTSSPYNTYKYIFTRTLKINSMADLKGKRVAYQRSIIIHERFLKKYPEIISVPVDNIDALALLIQNNKADAVIGGNIFKYFVQGRMLAAIHPEYIIPGSKVEVVYSIRKDWPELHSIINKALARLAPHEVAAILKKWSHTSETDSTRHVSLSQEEKAWLATDQTVRVRVTDFSPYIILKKEGEPEGIIIDHLSLIAERTGVTFSFIPSGKTFKEAIDGIKNHQGPDLIAAVVRTSERQQSILFTRDYIKSPFMIFMRDDRKRITVDMDSLIGKKVALLKGGALKSMVEKDYPGVQQILFNNHREAIDAVANKEAEAYIGNLTHASYNILKYGYYNLRMVAPTPFGDQVLSMGIRNDWHELAGIIDKGLATITPKEQNEIRNRYISLRYDQSNTAEIIKWVLITAGIGSSILLLFVFWNISLSRKVKKRTYSLERSAKTLETEIISRKKAEKQIKASLKEKETLLHEIHHRVKNNMQIIASLLDMLLGRKNKIDVETVVKESKGRVYAMAAIHESLHQSENFSEIDLNTYVQQLSSLLSQTYVANPERVHFDIEIPDIRLPIDKANPLGLVLNELISNSLKYAFPDDQKGTIGLKADIQDENIIEIVISDNGVGMPEGFDGRNTSSLGLNLVRSIAEDQLGGSVEMECINGTKFAIKFKIET